MSDDIYRQAIEVARAGCVEHEPRSLQPDNCGSEPIPCARSDSKNNRDSGFSGSLSSSSTPSPLDRIRSFVLQFVGAPRAHAGFIWHPFPSYALATEASVWVGFLGEMEKVLGCVSSIATLYVQYLLVIERDRLYEIVFPHTGKEGVHV